MPNTSGSANSVPPVSTDDYERAQKAIFGAISSMEKRVQQAVEKEVDTLFHNLEHLEKEEIKARAKKAVAKGGQKVRKTVDDHRKSDRKHQLPFYDLDSHSYPYEWPKGDPEHRILHAVEAAEKAVLQAVEKEVSTLFHSSDKHPENESKKQAHKVLKLSVTKTSSKSEESREERRRRFREGIQKATEEMLAMDIPFDE